MPLIARLARLALVVAVALAGVGALSLARAESLALEPMFGSHAFREPLLLLPAPARAGRAWYVVEQAGVIWRLDIDDAGLHQTLFADLRARIDSGPNEAGLLGMALHPKFAENGRVFLSYTAPGEPLVSHIAWFVSRDGGRTLDPESETTVLTLDQPYTNHNGGHIAFGPDGFLYAGFGDGGAGGDPHGNGQNVDTLLGKLLRLDIDGAAPYAIPPDNPFAKGGGRKEIYASGLRNPWRFSFDRATGALWLADVGQDKWEEVDLVTRGGNYGWKVREGAHCFKAKECRTEGLTDPVAEYDHDAGCSVTGGFVYRGKAIPALAGAYLYADFCTGTVWGLGAKAGGGFEPPRVLLASELNVSSFGEGPDGEVYLVDHQGGGVYRIVSK